MNLKELQIGVAVPVIQLANPQFNGEKISSILEEHGDDFDLLLFPCLSLTGTTCESLFNFNLLYRQQMNALAQVIEKSKNKPCLLALSIYLEGEEGAAICRLYIKAGQIVESELLPYDENFRYDFAGNRGSSLRLTNQDELPVGQLMPKVIDSSPAILPLRGGTFSVGSHFNGSLILDTPASPYSVGMADYIRTKGQTLSNHGRAYVYAAPGHGESTSNNVFAGHSLICSGGTIRGENTLFGSVDNVTSATILLSPEILGETNPGEAKIHSMKLPLRGRDMSIAYPFVSDDISKQCSEIFQMQTHALAFRLQAAGSKKIIVGVSGGVDSTAALLVACKANQLAGKTSRDVIAVTMPGFGTTDTTYSNALNLMELLDVTSMEISIVPSISQHFTDIGHNMDKHDTTYENAQARERTQILMDIANMESGLVVGTGDLSEEALGWCTYNGDHMAMYNVNSSIPKTLLKEVLLWFASENPELTKVLTSVVDTPISPELLPTDQSGNLVQKTEESIGPYQLHDYFLYHTLDSFIEPKALLAAAIETFGENFTPTEIEKYLRLFYTRFFSQQFKRNCAPDGPTVGPFSLSPHGEFLMGSDVSSHMWLSSLELD